jgi:hypothetical protein
MRSELVNEEGVSCFATSFKPNGYVENFHSREHPGLRPGLLYLMRLREHHRQQRTGTRNRAKGFVTQS